MRPSTSPHLRGVTMAGSRFEQLFERLYERRRSRYIEVLFALNTVWILVVAVPFHVSGGILVATIEPGEWLRFLLVSEAFIALATPGLIALLVRRTAPAIRLLRDDPAADPALAWKVVVADLPGTVFRGCVWIFLWVAAIFTYMGARLDMSAGMVLGLTAGAGMWMAGSGLFDYLLFERALRPVVREALAALPADFEPPAGAPSLRARLLVILLLLSLFSGTFVAGVTVNSTNALSLGWQFVVVFGVAISFMSTLALGLSLLVRESVLTRIEALHAAMGRVDRGEFDARVEPMGGDELDELGRSFNAMVGRLRTHDDELRESRARIVAAGDAARRQVERDLHDGAQQQLVTLRLRLGMARQAATGDPKVSALLDDAVSDLASALDELRNLAHGIYPAVLTTDGVQAALEVAAERCPLPVTVMSQGQLRRLAPEVEAAAYFCCVEALQNAAKHAGPDASVSIDLDFGGSTFGFAVRDDGAGYDAATLRASAGLQNMADRIGALGGTLRVESAPGAGTAVIGSMPQGAPR